MPTEFPLRVFQNTASHYSKVLIFMLFMWVLVWGVWTPSNTVMFFSPPSPAPRNIKFISLLSWLSLSSPLLVLRRSVSFHFLFSWHWRGCFIGLKSSTCAAFLFVTLFSIRRTCNDLVCYSLPVGCQWTWITKKRDIWVSGPLGCDTLSLGEWILTFRTKMLPSSSSVKEKA